MSDLDARFAEVEKRVRNLVADNSGLRKRVADLEQELNRVQREAGAVRDFESKQTRIREKIEQVLLSLESIAEKKG